MSLDVVLLQHNQAWLTVRCIESIRASSDVRLILVDNGSDPESLDQAAVCLTGSDALIRNGENKPFAVAVNQGLRMSDAEFVCIQNNDTVMGAEGYGRMLGLFSDPKVGAVGPLTNGADTRQRADKAGEGVSETDMLAFFCCILRRRAVDEVGPLSEEYGMAYGEDDDYCIRLKRAGWRLLIDRETWVHHDHHATYRLTLGEDGMEREGQQGLARLRDLYGA